MENTLNGDNIINGIVGSFRDGKKNGVFYRYHWGEKIWRKTYLADKLIHEHYYITETPDKDGPVFSTTLEIEEYVCGDRYASVKLNGFEEIYNHDASYDIESKFKDEDIIIHNGHVFFSLDQFIVSSFITANKNLYPRDARYNNLHTIYKNAAIPFNVIATTGGGFINASGEMYLHLDLTYPGNNGYEPLYFMGNDIEFYYNYKLNWRQKK